MNKTFYICSILKELTRSVLYRGILPKSKWLDAKALKQKDPQLNAKGLTGGYEFSDGQMDDYKLGLWVANKVKQAGGQLYENIRVKVVDEDGRVYLEKEKRIFFVLPWQEHTLLGTTEVRQNLDEPIECSKQEQDYAL